MPASLRSALATMPGQYRALVAHGPLSKDMGPLRLYRPLALRPGTDAPVGARSHLKVAMPT